MTRFVAVNWPNGTRSRVAPGTCWLQAAASAGVAIPTGCLGGSCGACEIEVNGQVVRACISSVPAAAGGGMAVELASDPYW